MRKIHLTSINKAKYIKFLQTVRSLNCNVRDRQIEMERVRKRERDRQTDRQREKERKKEKRKKERKKERKERKERKRKREREKIIRPKT